MFYNILKFRKRPGSLIFFRSIARIRKLNIFIFRVLSFEFWRIWLFFYKGIARDQRKFFSKPKFFSDSEFVLYFVVSISFVEIFVIQSLVDVSICSYDNTWILLGKVSLVHNQSYLASLFTHILFIVLNFTSIV